MFDFGYFMEAREAVFSDIVLAVAMGLLVIIGISFLVFKLLKPKPLTFNQIWKIKIGDKSGSIQ